MRKGVFGLCLYIIMLLFVPVVNASVMKPFLTAGQVRDLESLGFSVEQIRKAQLLSGAHDLSIDYMEILERAHTHEQWLALTVEYKNEFGEISLELAKLPTTSRTSPDDIEALFEYGFGIKEIVIADLVAWRFGWRIEEVLASKSPSIHWEQLITELYDWEVEKRDAMLRSESPTHSDDKAIIEVDGVLASDGSTPLDIQGGQLPDLKALNEVSAEYGYSQEFVAMLKHPEIPWSVVRALLDHLSSY